jgi:Ca2+-transporting ATPase
MTTPKGCYFELKPERVLEMFQTTVIGGLTEAEVQSRRGLYGSNKLPATKQVSAIVLLLRQFKDFMVLVLLLATIISFSLHETKSAIVLLVVILINASIGFVQELQVSLSSSHTQSLFISISLSL